MGVLGLGTGRACHMGVLSYAVDAAGLGPREVLADEP